MVWSHERYCCITGPLCGESIGLSGYIYSMVWSHERYYCITGPLCGESIGLSGYIYSMVWSHERYYCITGPLCGESIGLSGYIYSMVWSHERYYCITGPLCGESIGLSGYIYSVMSWEILFHCWSFVWGIHRPKWLHLQQEEIPWGILLLYCHFVWKIHMPKWLHLQHHVMGEYCCIAGPCVENPSAWMVTFTTGRNSVRFVAYLALCVENPWVTVVAGRNPTRDCCLFYILFEWRIHKPKWIHLHDLQQEESLWDILASLAIGVENLPVMWQVVFPHK